METKIVWVYVAVRDGCGGMHAKGHNDDIRIYETGKLQYVSNQMTILTGDGCD